MIRKANDLYAENKVFLRFISHIEKVASILMMSQFRKEEKQLNTASDSAQSFW